jgi:hypothetical protein
VWIALEGFNGVLFRNRVPDSQEQVEPLDAHAACNLDHVIEFFGKRSAGNPIPFGVAM